QPIQTIVVVLLPAFSISRYLIIIRDVDFLLAQIPIVVRHRGGAITTSTHAPTLIAVMVNDRATIPRCICRAGPACAVANLRQLTTAVVKKFVVNRSGSTKFLFGQPPEWRIKNLGRVVSSCAVS